MSCYHLSLHLLTINAKRIEVDIQETLWDSKLSCISPFGEVIGTILI